MNQTLVVVHLFDIHSNLIWERIVSDASDHNIWSDRFMQFSVDTLILSFSSIFVSFSSIMVSFSSIFVSFSSILVSFRRIFIVHLGVPWAWYTQDYFLQMSKMREWAKWTNEQMSKHFYSFKKMSTHFYYKMSKWVNEQNSHMSKFGVKWAPEILIYYKNTPGCTMLMVHPGVPWVNSSFSSILVSFSAIIVSVNFNFISVGFYIFLTETQIHLNETQRETNWNLNTSKWN